MAKCHLDRGQLLGVVRSITAGAVDRREVLPCQLALPQAYHVYESRSGRALGKVTQVQDSLPRGVARVYALLPYPVTKVTVTGPATAQAGQPLALKLAVAALAGSTLGTHVLHLAVIAPGGKERPWYAQNVVARGGQATATVPLALNDPPGGWVVTVTDMATKMSGRLAVTIK